jgi:hypothetical protein
LKVLNNPVLPVNNIGITVSTCSSVVATRQIAHNSNCCLRQPQRHAALGLPHRCCWYHQEPRAFKMSQESCICGVMCCCVSAPCTVHLGAAPMLSNHL